MAERGAEPVECENCGKPMAMHGPLAECWPIVPNGSTFRARAADVGAPAEAPTGVGATAGTSPDRSRTGEAMNAWERIKAGLCAACGERERHFVPPSLGDEGFFYCTQALLDGKAVPL